jgi:hypothetical protein
MRTHQKGFFLSKWLVIMAVVITGSAYAIHHVIERQKEAGLAGDDRGLLTVTAQGFLALVQEQADKMNNYLSDNPDVQCYEYRGNGSTSDAPVRLPSGRVIPESEIRPSYRICPLVAQ